MLSKYKFESERVFGFANQTNGFIGAIDCAVIEPFITRAGPNFLVHVTHG